MHGIQQDISIGLAMDGRNPQRDAARRFQPLVADRSRRFGVWNGIPSRGKCPSGQVGDDLIGYFDCVHDVSRARNVRSEVYPKLEDRKGFGARAVDHPMTLAVPAPGSIAPALPVQNLRGIDLLAEPVHMHGSRP